MKKVWMFIGTAVIVLASLYLLQRLLMPKYAADVVEGALIAEYYEEEKDHDVIFIGDCEVYENFSPAVLWQNYGINSYAAPRAGMKDTIALLWIPIELREMEKKYGIPCFLIRDFSMWK